MPPRRGSSSKVLCVKNGCEDSRPVLTVEGGDELGQMNWGGGTNLQSLASLMDYSVGDNGPYSLYRLCSGYRDLSLVPPNHRCKGSIICGEST